MKKDRLVVTISDINSSKSYNLNKIIKKIILWALLSIIFVVALSIFTISKLVTSVDNLTTERDRLEQQSNYYNDEIKAKVEKIEKLGEKLETIEEMIGISSDDTTDLIQRATLATITTAQKSYMLQTIPNNCPMKECKVTSKFGWRIHPVTGENDFHKGVDYRAARRTPVKATADGVVRYVQDKNEGNYGRVIIIMHNFGFETVYAHLRYTDVKVGDVVKKGQQIGRSGNSGRSSGPHLHYEVRYASKILDPKDFIGWDMKNYDKIFEKQRRVKWESLVKMISNQHNKQAQQ